jgi:TolA-binding protein
MTHCTMGPEPAERYVAGDMPELERAGFEEHFFECDACFRTVQALEDARHVLAEQGPNAGVAPAASGRGLPLRWMAAAATLVVSAGLSVVVWRDRTPIDVRPDATPTGEAQAALPPAVPRAPLEEAPAPAPQPAAPPPPSTQGRLERWAAVTPPQYVALTTRSGQDQSEDEDTRTFNEAMAHYSAGRHRRAADALQPLADRAPAAAHVQFFLGISELMSGNVARARGALQRTAESGVSPYADEAHFYLAKAALRAGDLTTGVRELQIAVEREAGPEGDAAKLLAELRRVGR